MPGFFQKQSLLWVHAPGFPRRDGKKVAVELIDAIKDPTPLADAFIRLLPIGRIILVDIPSLRRNLPDGIDSPKKIITEFMVVPGVGKPAGHADDGNISPSLPLLSFHFSSFFHCLAYLESGAMSLLPLSLIQAILPLLRGYPKSELYVIVVLSCVCYRC